MSVGSSTRSPPVFVHSSFRTSSTWLWTRFRADPRALAYNEIFNELLAGLTAQAAVRRSTADWPSGHPDTAPYFLEYLPLIAPGGGVRRYRPSMGIERLIPESGAGGPLSRPELSYVKGLIDLAARHGRVPVLTCTRSLARLPGLKRAFGGTHVFLYRNLFQQWNSYAHQHLGGNDYFLRALVDTLRHHHRDIYVLRLLEIMVRRAGGDLAGWLGPEHYDALFAVFCGLHLYLSMVAWRDADVVIDVTALAGDTGMRQSMERKLAAATSLTVALGDARAVIQTPRHRIGDQAVWGQVEALLADAVTAAGADAATSAFGRRLLDQAWDEYCRFQAGSAGRNAPCPCGSGRKVKHCHGAVAASG